MESVQRPAQPHQYAGLGAGIDPHGYLVVVADPEYDDHPRVCTEIIVITVAIINSLQE